MTAAQQNKPLTDSNQQEQQDEFDDHPSFLEALANLQDKPPKGKQSETPNTQTTQETALETNNDDSRVPTPFDKTLRLNPAFTLPSIANLNSPSLPPTPATTPPQQ